MSRDQKGGVSNGGVDQKSSAVTATGATRFSLMHAPVSASLPYDPNPETNLAEAVFQLWSAVGNAHLTNVPIQTRLNIMKVLQASGISIERIFKSVLSNNIAPKESNEVTTFSNITEIAFFILERLPSANVYWMVPGAREIIKLCTFILMQLKKSGASVDRIYYLIVKLYFPHNIVQTFWLEHLTTNNNNLIEKFFDFIFELFPKPKRDENYKTNLKKNVDKIFYLFNMHETLNLNILFFDPGKSSSIKAIKKYLNCLAELRAWGLESQKIEDVLTTPSSNNFIDSLINEGNGELILSFMTRDFPRRSALIRKKLYENSAVKKAVLNHFKTLKGTDLDFMLELALNPKSYVGELFWTSRLGIKPSLEKGTLAEIGNLMRLSSLTVADVRVQELSKAVDAASKERSKDNLQKLSTALKFTAAPAQDARSESHRQYLHERAEHIIKNDGQPKTTAGNATVAAASIPPSAVNAIATVQKTAAQVASGTGRDSKTAAAMVANFHGTKDDSVLVKFDAGDAKADIAAAQHFGADIEADQQTLSAAGSGAGTSDAAGSGSAGTPAVMGNDLNMTMFGTATGAAVSTDAKQIKAEERILATHLYAWLRVLESDSRRSIRSIALEQGCFLFLELNNAGISFEEILSLLFKLNLALKPNPRSVESTLTFAKIPLNLLRALGANWIDSIKLNFYVKLLLEMSKLSALYNPLQILDIFKPIALIHNIFVDFRIEHVKFVLDFLMDLCRKKVLTSADILNHLDVTRESAPYALFDRDMPEHHWDVDGVLYYLDFLAKLKKLGATLDRIHKHLYPHSGLLFVGRLVFVTKNKEKILLRFISIGLLDFESLSSNPQSLHSQFIGGHLFTGDNKELIAQYIIKECGDNVLEEALNKETYLGKFFWRARLKTEPSLEKGTLKTLSDEKKRRASSPLDAKRVTSKLLVPDEKQGAEIVKRFGIAKVAQNPPSEFKTINSFLNSLCAQGNLPDFIGYSILHWMATADQDLDYDELPPESLTSWLKLKEDAKSATASAEMPVAPAVDAKITKDTLATLDHKWLTQTSIADGRQVFKQLLAAPGVEEKDITQHLLEIVDGIKLIYELFIKLFRTAGFINKQNIISCLHILMQLDFSALTRQQTEHLMHTLNLPYHVATLLHGERDEKLHHNYTITLLNFMMQLQLLFTNVLGEKDFDILAFFDNDKGTKPNFNVLLFGQNNNPDIEAIKHYLSCLIILRDERGVKQERIEAHLSHNNGSKNFVNHLVESNNGELLFLFIHYDLLFHAQKPERVQFVFTAEVRKAVFEYLKSLTDNALAIALIREALTQPLSSNLGRFFNHQEVRPEWHDLLDRDHNILDQLTHEVFVRQAKLSGNPHVLLTQHTPTAKVDAKLQTPAAQGANAAAGAATATGENPTFTDSTFDFGL